MNPKHPRCNACLTATFLLLIAADCFPAHANFSGSDDFSVPSASWGADSASSAGLFDLQNGKLSFVTQGPPTINDTVQRQWVANVGDYTADWSVRVDMAIGDFAMTADQFSSLDILVENSADVPNDFVRLILRRDGVTNRYIYADANSNGVSNPGSVFIPTLTTQATLGLSYNSTERVITGAYDADGPLNGFTFQPILSVPIELGLSDWNMDPSDSFHVWLVGQTQYLDVTLGQMTLDNFVASGEQLLIVPEPAIGAMLGLLLASVTLRPRCYR